MTLSVLEPEIFGRIRMMQTSLLTALRGCLNGGSDGLLPFGGRYSNAALQIVCFNVQSLIPERFKGVCAFGGYIVVGCNTLLHISRLCLESAVWASSR